jgi:signal transduction histidine kinase
MALEMKKEIRSLQTDLLVDLSLLTLCALLLSQAIMVIMMRIELPRELEAVARPLLESAFLELEREAKSNPSLPVDQVWALVKERADPTQMISLSIGSTDLKDLPTQALIHQSLHPEEERLFGLIPYRTSYVYVAQSLNSEIILLRWSMSSFQNLLTSFKFRLFFLTLVIEVILVFLAYWLLFRRNILDPIASLGQVSTRFLQEDWSARVPIGRQDELGKVGEALNEMAHKIEEKEKKLVLTIESLRSANEELELRQNEQLQIEKLASIGRLAAGVAHEVGNPLGAISGYVDILRRSLQKSQVLGAEDIDLCDRIEAETNRISKIIRALLQQARPTKERIGAVLLKPILVRCVSLAQIPSAIDVSYEFEDENACVSAEDDQLVQVFLNLLVNAKHAIDAHKKRAEPGRLTIKCALRKLPIYRNPTTEGGDYDTSVVRALKPEVYWVVTIEDNGIGISEEDQKKLFEPFFSTKEPGKGTGLGLYVTKSIIESFRGAIVLRSAAGYGAAFSVFLPRSKS